MQINDGHRNFDAHNKTVTFHRLLTFVLDLTTYFRRTEWKNVNNEESLVKSGTQADAETKMLTESVNDKHSRNIWANHY